jgi:hypothetical protein
LSWVGVKVVVNYARDCFWFNIWLMLVFHTKIVMASLLQCVAAGVWRQGADGEYEGECEFATAELCSRELSSHFCVWWLIREWMLMFVLQLIVVHTVLLSNWFL